MSLKALKDVSYFKLNNEINRPVNGQIPLQKDQEALQAFFEESVLPYADLTRAVRPNRIKRVNVDFPLWMVEELDREAARLNVPRQALIKVWLADCLKDARRASA